MSLLGWRSAVVRALRALKALAHPPTEGLRLQLVDTAQEARPAAVQHHGSPLLPAAGAASGESDSAHPAEALGSQQLHHSAVTKEEQNCTRLHPVVKEVCSKAAAVAEDNSLHAAGPLEGSCPCVSELTDNREDPEFELWVETELEAAWCLEDSSTGPGPWRGVCQTSTVRRRWEEFEALGGVRHSGLRPGERCGEVAWSAACPEGSACSTVASLSTLGLPGDADEAQVRAAFRRCFLTSHPDKGGSVDAFNNVLKAYRSLAQDVVRRA